MNRGISLGVFVLIVFAATLSGVSQSRPPGIFVDHNICPGEGCDYKGTHAKVVAATKAYRAPTTTSGRAFTIPIGLLVTGIDSVVRTRAGQFRVKYKHGVYRPGDVLFVYTYLGEGYFKVWHRGKMIEEDLGFSVWGGSAGERCELDPENCWGILEKRTDMKWWLKVRLNDGRKGWILVDDNLIWLER